MYIYILSVSVVSENIIRNAPLIIRNSFTRISRATLYIHPTKKPGMIYHLNHKHSTKKELQILLHYNLLLFFFFQTKNSFHSL